MNEIGSLGSFSGATAGVHRDASVSLRAGGNGVAIRSGRVARWVARFRTSENRAVAHKFAASLRQRYGTEVSDQVMRGSGLDRHAARGKPLRARHVQEAVRRADVLFSATRERNAMVAQSYSRPVSVGTDQSLLRIKIDDVARQFYPANPTVTKLVDPQALATKVEDAIATAGQNGRHFVTTEEAAGVLSNVVTEELNGAYHNARDRALASLTLDHPGSISCQALAEAAGGCDPALHIDTNRLTPDVHAELASRFQAAVSDGAVPAERLHDAASLRALAGKVIGEFVAERAAAQKALDGLPVVNTQTPLVSAQQKAALMDQVVHDNVPAAVVPSMAWAYVKVADDVAALGNPPNAGDLGASLASIRTGMTDAFADAGVPITVENQAPMHRMCWRFLLAPGGAAQKEFIAAQLQPGAGALRSVGEGASWYREVFPGTDEAERTWASSANDYAEQPVYAEASFRDATRYAVLMGALAEVATEGAAPEQRVELEANGTLPDEAIATLRNLGIPIPAPDRLGHSNAAVPISAGGLAAIREELADQYANMSAAPLKNGLLQESTRDFNRATYRVDGKELPRSEEAVTRELRDLCTDKHGQLDERLLKSVSTIAYQAGPGCVYAAVFNPMRPDLAVFDGMPGVNPTESSFNLSRGDNGDVIVRCLRYGEVTRLDRSDAQGMMELVPVDRNASSLDLTVEFRIDAATCEPRLEDVRIGYRMAPGEALETSDGPA